ncbi:MAG: DUF4230 domain-containing protein [Bacteroidetes bacterium]|nr:MAG: DUF4230 domain-containing protein [Bacteroidota bacterium]
MKKRLKLFRTILSLGILAVLILLVWKFCSGKGEAEGFQIENTPMRIERIRNIAHLATISYKDEVVIDSTEYYQSTTELVNDKIAKITDPDNIKHALDPYVKRKLTLIVKGEIRYGFDLKDSLFTIEEKEQEIFIRLPNPKILDVISTPSSTKIFLENGRWKDHEITIIQQQARKKMIDHFLDMKLENQAKYKLEKTIRQLIPPGKSIRFRYP